MQSDESTQSSPEIFKLMVDQVKDYAIFMLDPEGYIRTWNEGARRIQGYEAPEIIGKHFSIFYPPADISADKPNFELRMARDLGRYEDEGWRVRKDGSRFWANVVVAPLREDGKLVGFAKLSRDLTQRKFQDDNFQRLLETEERFRLLVEQVKDYAIFILDAKGNVSSWNQGAKRLKGYSADEIIGKHFSIFYTPDDIIRDHPTRELNQTIREGHYEEEGWRLKKDGSRFWASVVLTALWDKRGNLTGFAKVTRDLSEKRKEQEALRQKTEDLEAFAHTISHDLRAPLRSISTFADILISDGKDLSEPEKKEYLEKILRSAQSMDGLVNDLLKFSQLSLAPAPEELVPLAEVIQDSLRLLEGEIQRTKAEVEIEEALPSVRGNRTLLVQIFSNLIANALKFTAQGQRPKVEVFVVQNSDQCEIHVKDSGIGIPSEYHETIFKMFERGTTTSDINGTGVGLAIVKKAAERLGGSVSVHSTEGEGSDFVVSLPCWSPTPVGVSV